MKKGHVRRQLSPGEARDSEESEGEIIRPTLVSVDAAIAMSRRVVKESLDLNVKSPCGKYDLPRDSQRRQRYRETEITEETARDKGREMQGSTGSPSHLLERLQSEEILKRYYEKELITLREQMHVKSGQTQEMEGIRKELYETKEALRASEATCNELSTLLATKDRTFTSKLLEMESIVKSLNKELRKKNSEITRIYSILSQSEERESLLKQDLKRTQESIAEMSDKSALERKIMQDGQTDLRADIQILEKQLREKTATNEKAVGEIATLEVRLKAAEHTVEKLTNQIETLHKTHSEALSKLKLQVSEEEAAKLRLARQLQDLSSLQSHTIDYSSQLSKAEEKLKSLEATHMQQLNLNLRLQEEVKRLQEENEDLRRRKEEEMRRAREEVNQQTAKFAQKIEDLESQFQKHIRGSQEPRLASSFENEPTSPSPHHYRRSSKSSASLKAPRRHKV